MYLDHQLYMGLSDEGRINMNLSMCNRHGLIAGASGTGKTITMKVMAESFSDAGVPVFLCDVKGDVSGLCVPGVQNEGMEKRINKFGIRDSFTYKKYPVVFWDIYQKSGHPIRVKVSDMGPEILARLLGLSDAQEGVLHILFKIADDHGLELIDLKDLRAMIEYVSEHRTEYITTYGNMTVQSLGGIQRALLPLETQGGDVFFGEPELDIHDWIKTDADGHGIINLLDCVELIQNPKLYACFLLWMMSALFEELPEVGDMEKPKLVFFFDEAHMLFTDAPRVLVQKIEQLVRLIRSKGVGIYFVTQSPSDIPDSVLSQLSNRVQHALRAYTPTEMKAVRTAAQTMQTNPNFKTEEVIMQLGVGEALISFLDEKGIPGIVQKTAVICPQSLMAQADPASRDAAYKEFDLSRYDQAVDNISAYEKINEQREKDSEREKLEEERAQLEKEKAELEKLKEKEEEAKRKKEEREKEKQEEKKKREADRRKQKIETQLISATGQILKRGLLGTLFGRR